MKIQVLHNFGGKETQERRIEPGVYESGDPALFGLADYLIASGHAVALADQDAPPKDAPLVESIRALAEVVDDTPDSSEGSEIELKETQESASVDLDITHRPKVKDVNRK